MLTLDDKRTTYVEIESLSGIEFAAIFPTCHSESNDRYYREAKKRNGSKYFVRIGYLYNKTGIENLQHGSRAYPIAAIYESNRNGHNLTLADFTGFFRDFDPLEDSEGEAMASEIAKNLDNNPNNWNRVVYLKYDLLNSKESYG